MKIIVLAACFLFFCHVPQHRHVIAHGACETILKGYDAGNQDEFVKSFPVREQHRVLVCIEKAKTGEVK